MKIRRVVVSVLVSAAGFVGCGGGESPDRVATQSPPQPPTPKPAAPKPEPVLDPNPRFVDVAKQSGLSRVLWCGGTDKDHLLESVGSGAAMIDYDEDGKLDLFVVNGWALDENPSRVREKGRNALYRNLGGGRFEDATDRAGVADEGWGCGVCAADYDNDGHVDLYITHFGTNRLYRNRGGGTFEQVAEHAGVATQGWSSGASFFDADGDGHLDLYVANYIEATLDEVLAARRTTLWQDTIKVMAGPFGLRGGKDHFYHNNGDGTFRDATEEVGMTDLAESYGLGVLASDLDNDGDIDVYVANDSNPNFLYRNDGTGKFTDIGTISGAGLSGEGVAQASMGVDAADFDGDGLQDIFTTHFSHDYSTFYRNLGGLNFEDISVGLRLKEYTYMSLSWGCTFFDFDQDADVDIMIANGHIYPQVDTVPGLKETYRQKPMLLRNDKGALSEVSASAGPGFQDSAAARGLAVGDYDDDGDLDVLMTAID
ncbi:FG-GAP repeat domain-containing protein, partial [Singulisphaera rosea]